MSYVTGNQPNGTPTWIDLGVPDPERAMAFYRALFGWDFEVGPAETGGYTLCLLRDKPVAGLAPEPDPAATAFWWNMYFATDDCDGTVMRVIDAGGTLVVEPMDVTDQGRMAVAQDPTGNQFGLWEGRAHPGCAIVNEPNTLLRNDLVTPTPEPARSFYTTVFNFTLDGNESMPDLDFTFLRRSDGHEIGGIIAGPDTAPAGWGTLFMVADADATARAAVAAGGEHIGTETTPYGRIATIKDPFGAEFTIGSGS